MKKTTLLKTLPALALACALAACGGGGSDSSSGTDPANPGPGPGPIPTSYTVTPTVSGGTLSPSGPVSVSSGSTVTFTLTPDSGNSLTSLNVSNTCGGGTLSGNTYRVGPVTANCTVTVTFNPPAPVASFAACFTATKTVSFAQTGINVASGTLIPRITVGPMTYSGQAVTGQTYTYPSGASISKYTDYWTVTSSGVLWIAEVITAANGNVTTLPLSWTFPQNMSPGQVASGWTFVGFETISLAGKTFSNTCHMKAGTDEAWYAPGYGAVKQIVSAGIMQYSGDL